MDWRDRIDDALDATVVLSFTSIGYHLRRRLQRWEPLPSLRGKRVLVTGANGGIGFAAAQRFADAGALVHLGVRDLERGAAARDRILRATPGADVHVELVDMSRPGSVRELAEHLRADYSHLDVLVHNAGALTAERTVTADGNEQTFATHVIGPFLLTALVWPLLAASDDARVITVTSGGMYTATVDMANLQSDHGTYRGSAAYAQAKRAQVLLTEAWAERAAGSAVRVHAMHPGWVDTPGVAASLPRFRMITRPFLRTPPQGADTIVWLAAADEPRAHTGALWLDRRRRATHKLRRTRAGDAVRGELFAAVRALSGATGPLPGD